MSLKDKVVIVTGAGVGGIGAAVAIEAVKEGAYVALVGRRETKLNKTAAKCTAITKKVLIIVADVSKDEDAQRIVKTTVDFFGKLDILVNNAGISRPGGISDGEIVGAYDAIMNTNVRAVINLTTLATPYLQKTKGNVINISSCAASTAALGTQFFAYSISKAALNQFTRCAAAELAAYGIRVNSVNPGPVETDFLENSHITSSWEDIKPKTALNKIVQPQEVADMVVFLASDKARSVTGSHYIIDSGYLIKNS